MENVSRDERLHATRRARKVKSCVAYEKKKKKKKNFTRVGGFKRIVRNGLDFLTEVLLWLFMVFAA